MARAVVVIVVGGLEGCCDVFWYQARKKDTLDRSGQEGEETLCNSVSLPSFFFSFSHSSRSTTPSYIRRRITPVESLASLKHTKVPSQIEEREGKKGDRENEHPHH